MSNTIFRSTIWRKTLAENSEFSKNYKEDVETLRTSFLDIRKKADTISKNIVFSQQGLTLHDQSHLDSLWETASTIAGEELELNPIEAYIFGCAILFHDLGMAQILWEEQLSCLKESKEYKDIAHALLSNKLGRTPSEQDMTSLPNETENIVIATRLRELHPFKARELPLKSWQFQSQTLYLIESSELRQKLGEKIGIIAESHWWNVEDIRGYFKQPFSPSPTPFPAEWKINNIKLACLLRLADFIHIDDRRAPTFQYFFAKPQDESNYHWLFQNKLNRAHCDGERLVFESKSPFLYTENKAWWLAYNTVVEIDKELKAVDNLLIDTNTDRFQCRGVKGIESEKLFSDYVRTENWEPANTNFKIGNFTNLIEKLGGKELYGEKHEVPLRELIQNSSDAIQAKRHLIGDFKGDIIVKYYEDDRKDIWVEIEDNGIGMSKTALLYGILDFGNSYWKSNLIRKEHPGLQSSGFSPTGGVYHDTVHDTLPATIVNYHPKPPSPIVVGGLTQGFLSLFPGIWVGENEIISRSYAKPVCTLQELTTWLQAQYELIVSKNPMTEEQSYEVAKICYSLGIESKNLPIATTSKGKKSYVELTKLDFNDFVFLRFKMENQDYDVPGKKILPNIICIESSRHSISIMNKSLPLWKEEIDSLYKERYNVYNKLSPYDSLLVQSVIQAICVSWELTEQEVLKESLIDQIKGLLVDVYEDQYGQLTKLPVAVIVNPKKTSLKEVFKKHRQDLR